MAIEDDLLRELLLIKLLCLWDYEGAKIPWSVDADKVLPRLIGLLDSLGYKGTFGMEAIVAQLTPQRITEARYEELVQCHVQVTSVFDKKFSSDLVPKQAADKVISKRVKDWCSQRSDGLLVVIGSDGDHSNAVKMALASKKDVILIHNPDNGLSRYPKVGRRFKTIEWNEGFFRQNYLFQQNSLFSADGTLSGRPVVAPYNSIVWAEGYGQGQDTRKSNSSIWSPSPVSKAKVCETSKAASMVYVPKGRTSVFWDIKTYPVPRGCDAGLVSWSINRYVRKLGYSGPLTIIAVGLLTDVPEGLLRKLSSTGIVLNHVPFGSIGILRSMDWWKHTPQAPANMMLISSDESILPRIRHSSGYNIRQLLPNYSANAWRNFLLRDLREWTGTDSLFANWLCSVCNNDGCPGFENFTTHLSSKEHADKAIRVAVEAVGSTWVLWDMNSCPFPPDCDPRRVRPLIKQFLEDFGYSGSFTITATGLLTDVPRDVLRALMSTEIRFHHTSDSDCIWSIRDKWLLMNPRPATILLISQYSKISSLFVLHQQDMGCNVIELFPYNSRYSESLWKTFLLEREYLLEDKCSATGEHASWVCSVRHLLSGKGFDNFITHLADAEHEPPPVWKTTVFWDINSFPVPAYCDARFVCLTMKLYLKYQGYSRFTINAIGLLTDVHPDVLRAVSATGIILNHVSDSAETMYHWARLNSPPANMVVMCPYSDTVAKAVDYLRKKGYTITLPFESAKLVSHSECLWDMFLLRNGTLAEDKCSETDDSWVCLVSHDISCKGFDNFITHLTQEHVKEEPKEILKTTVFWDIKGYPVPPFCDARHVCLSIKLYLEYEYYSRFTINAIGLLTDVHPDVLRAISATGIVLNHAPSDSADTMYHWARLNSPPANMVVMCPYSDTVAKAVDYLRKNGYTITVPFQSECYSKSLWKDFLLRNGTLLGGDKCSETDVSWVCSVYHDLSGKGFDNFITHLSEEHKQEKMWGWNPPMLTLPVGMYSFCFPPLETVSEVVEAGVEATNLKKSGRAGQRLKEKQNKELMKETKEASKAGDDALVCSLRKTVSYKDVKRMSKSPKTKKEEMESLKTLAKAGDEALCSLSSLRKTVSDQYVSKYFQTRPSERQWEKLVHEEIQGGS